MNKIKSIFSFEEVEISAVSDILDILGKNGLSKGYFLAYFHNEILTGLFNGKSITLPENKTFPIKYLEKARFFNDSGELKIYKEKDKYAYRLVIDNDAGEDYFIKDSSLKTFGTKPKDLENGFTLLSEESGHQVIVPLKTKKEVAVKVRSYIKPNDIGISEYFDHRIMAFEEV